MAPTPSSQVVTIDNLQRCIHTWKPTNPSDNLPLVIVYHGFLAHGLYPTVRYAAEWLSDHGYLVVAADMRGHGKSEGLPGFLTSADDCIADGLAVAKYATELHQAKGAVLLGSSMGGTIALQVANKWDGIHAELKGVVLLAPMLKLKVSAIEETLLYSLSCILPNALPLIPSSALDASKQYRDEAKRRECEDDTGVVQLGKMRLGSAYTCIQLVKQIKPINAPVLIMVADEDVVVNPQGSLDFYEQSKDNCTLKRYPALHGLLCEPSPLLDTIQGDMLAWIKDHSS